jgi:hypothetical protein
MAGHHEHVKLRRDDVVLNGTADDQYAYTPDESAYERTDAHVWIIVKFMFWLAVSAAIIHVGLWLLFGAFVENRRATEEPEFPMAVGQQQRLPAEPRLQQFPLNDAYNFRRQEQSAVNGYSWVDRNAGTVQIPLAEAMRMVVERGLPSRAQGAAPAGVPVATPGAGADTPADPGTPQPEAGAQPASGGVPAVSGAQAGSQVGLVPADSSSGRTFERRRQ